MTIVKNRCPKDNFTDISKDSMYCYHFNEGETDNWINAETACIIHDSIGANLATFDSGEVLKHVYNGVGNSGTWWIGYEWNKGLYMVTINFSHL